MSALFKRPTLAALLGAAALAGVAAPAAAQDSSIVVRGLPEGTKMQMVSYGDLNLRLIAHLNILNDRVGRAVRQVCEFEPRDNMNSGYRNCADRAWAGARPQIHRAYLRANHLAGL
jgi:UrcA family protein